MKDFREETRQGISQNISGPVDLCRILSGLCMNHLASRCALFESIISFASIWHLSFVRRRSRYGESPASTPAFSWARFRMGTELGEGGVHARFSFAWCCRCRRWRRADRSVTWVAPTSLVRNRPLCLRREYFCLGGRWALHVGGDDNNSLVRHPARERDDVCRLAVHIGPGFSDIK